MLGMQKRAELTGGWAAKDWSWHKYRNSCGEAGEAAKLQALRQSATFFTDGEEEEVRFSCECRKVRTRQTRAKKKEARIIGGPKMGPSQKPPNLAPFFWPRPHCPQLGFGPVLGGYHNQGQTPRRSSVRLSQFMPAMLKETKEREYSVVSYRQFFF
jgi:hypothetical protein